MDKLFLFSRDFHSMSKNQLRTTRKLTVCSRTRVDVHFKILRSVCLIFVEVTAKFQTFLALPGRHDSELTTVIDVISKLPHFLARGPDR